jgi:hypothetical protein
MNNSFCNLFPVRSAGNIDTNLDFGTMLPVVSEALPSGCQRVISPLADFFLKQPAGCKIERLAFGILKEINPHAFALS